SNAILEGDLNLKEIIFLNFVKLNECKKRYSLSMGGNIKKFKDNKILWTIGDYESYETNETKKSDDPQNLNSYYGKILTLNMKTKNIKILSMGHRNPQGIFYDKNDDIVFSTEHGPQGGDEINININPDEKHIKNYGWAISSYGEHYGNEQGLSEKIKNNPNILLEMNGGDKESVNNHVYTIAPLYKSHKAYGFEEPIKYFTPSIGITEILKVENFLNDDHNLLVASMGYDKEEDDMTLHILNFDKDFNQTKYEKIYIGERIRDIINLGDGTILMTIESSGSLALLRNIY
ncbi:PQQ-dependent sugar dehydrogenase, partial [Candidatus Pelagibacter sp.]|nr:PQQ-dependent sugar dehydrogenase [Candidatus Pelagibacter sp.]